MRMRPLRRYACARIAPAVGLALLGATVAGAEGQAWHVLRGEVRVVCPLTVGGSFEAKAPALSGDLAVAGERPLLLTGSLSVDLRTLDTGIGLRNEHLRNVYLEVSKGDGFENAVLSDIRLGDVDPATFQGRTTFSGTFLLHGVKATVGGPAEIHREGASVRIEASFPVVLADYGIVKPQYLGVGVKSEVLVKASLVAAPGREAR
jgi:YceI-like protein